MFLLLQLHLYFLFFRNHDQFLDSISKAYPGIVDHLNIASIEKADNSPAEMEIDQSTEEGIVFTSNHYFTIQYDSKKQMYILSKERGDNIYYPNYLPDSILEEGLKAGRLFKGVYHANQDNITEGHVIVHEFIITHINSIDI